MDPQLTAAFHTFRRSIERLELINPVSFAQCTDLLRLLEREVDRSGLFAGHVKGPGPPIKQESSYSGLSDPMWQAVAPTKPKTSPAEQMLQVVPKTTQPNMAASSTQDTPTMSNWKRKNNDNLSGMFKRRKISRSVYDEIKGALLDLDDHDTLPTTKPPVRMFSNSVLLPSNSPQPPLTQPPAAAPVAAQITTSSNTPSSSSPSGGFPNTSLVDRLFPGMLPSIDLPHPPAFERTRVAEMSDEEFADMCDREPEEEKKRMVIILDLPLEMTLMGVSSLIANGALLAIQLIRMQQASPRSARAIIIFHWARDAHNFVLATQQDKDSADFCISNPNQTARPAERRVLATACPGATAVLGDPFPLTKHLALMGTLGGPSRRLKVNGQRLFLQVPLQAFKRDVFEMVGWNGTCVELFHFYNAGEATVVLSSVGIAMHVLRTFRALQAAQRTRRAENRRAGRPVAPLPGQQGNESFPFSGHRYHGDYSSCFEINFARDFNESRPAALVTAYPEGMRGPKPRWGLPGIFQGPHVAWKREAKAIE